MSNEKTREVTPVGRIAFTKNLFKKNDKGRYTCALIIDKDKDISKLRALVKEAMDEQWPGKKPKGLKTPIKEEIREDMLENYPYMADAYTLNASTGFDFSIIDLNNEEMFEGDIKAGDQVRISVSAYVYDNQTKGVGLNINAIQFIREDEAFSARASAKDMFSGADVEKFEAEVSGTDSDDDLDNMGF